VNPRTLTLRIAALLAVSGLAACYSEDPVTTPTLGTVGEVPEASATTFLPDVIITDPGLTSSLPAGVMFAGDPCSALVAADFGSVSIGGLPPGSLVDSSLLSPDTCGYSVLSGRTAFTIEVAVRTQQEFENPEQSGATSSAPVAGVGLGAIGYERTDGKFVVIAHVDNGYFSVTSADADSAAELAAIAVDRVAG
jgi:hypothetical protein